MLNIPKINNNVKVIENKFIIPQKVSTPAEVLSTEPHTTPSAELMRAYNPAFKAADKADGADKAANTAPESAPEVEKTEKKEIKLSDREKLDALLDKSDIQTKNTIKKLKKSGILDDKSSNDGSSVLDNLYRIISEPRITGLKEELILAETVKALDNPASITQKFGDIPDGVAAEIEAETGEKFPEEAKNVISSCCVAASIEYNMASQTPAEFARFANELSGKDYGTVKKIKISDIADGMASGVWMLREFNTENKISKNWDDVSIKITPDRNAIVRARVQTSYKDPGERSCVDVLIQSALLNLGSQHTYNSITDERTGRFNPEKTGLTDFEKNFVEEVIFGTPKISAVYQNIDENGFLIGYNCEPEETKQHIIKSLNAGHNVIIGYTHLDKNNKVDGGHEITITEYKTDKNGNGIFVCNDTDDNKDKLIEISEEKLLPLIHHAGIPKDALNEDDTIVETWREVLKDLQNNVLPQKETPAA